METNQTPVVIHSMISVSPTTRTGTGKVIPVDPIYTAVGVIALAIVIPLAIMAYLGRGSTKQLRADQETLRLQRAATDAKIRSAQGKDVWAGRA